MKAKKYLGQNFLTDKNKVKEIVAGLNINENTNIIEVGPGQGAITYPMALLANSVKAIEIDLDMVEILSSSTTLEIIHGDILKIDLSEIVTGETMFVSNLPYYISTKILFKILEIKDFKYVNVMMQKELIDRITSPEGNKAYGRLSVGINSFFNVVKRIDVNRECFTPAPNVDSAFIYLERREDKITETDKYLEFIKISFAQKRKKWTNSLKNNNFEFIDEIKEWLNEKGYPETYRAEQIKVEEFIEVFNIIMKIKR